MALIKCPECGGQVSDRADVCIHCGYPLKEIKEKVIVTKSNSVSKENELFRIELQDIKDKKAKVQGILKRHCNMDAYKAFDVFKNLPQTIYETNNRKSAILLAQELINCDVEFQVYQNDGKIAFDLVPQEEVKEIKQPGYWNTSSKTNQLKKIKCPSCGKLIDQSSRKCPSCGFSEISSYLLQQIRSQEEKNQNISNQIKCPNCGSTQIQMVPRKWSLLTGFFTNKVDRVCIKCKHKF